MKRWNHMLVTYLINNEVIEKEEKEIYEYGFEVFFVNFLQFFVLLFLGFIFRHIIETMLFLLVFTSVRSFSGGYHSRTFIGCGIMTILLWGIALMVTAFLAADSQSQMSFLFLGGVLTILTIGIYAPVDNVKKPLSLKKIRKNRKKSILSLIIWLMATSILVVYNIWYADFIVCVLIEISLLLLWEKYKNTLTGSIECKS